jgi:hypothetical protein
VEADVQAKLSVHGRTVPQCGALHTRNRNGDYHMAKKMELTATLHAAIMRADCPLSMAQLAEALDKAPSTIYNELNPYPSADSRHKLGLEDAAEIARAIGDESLARHFAAHVCGRTLMDPATGQPDGRDMDHECLQGFQAVAEFVKAAEGGARRAELSPLLEHAIKELQDVFTRAEG